MTFLKLVEEHSAKGRMKELDELMTNYIDSQLNEIEKDLVARYPNRAALLVEAFKAHRLENVRLVDHCLALTGGWHLH